MPSKHDITSQQKLLAMYRDLLAEHLRQQTLWSRTEIPAFLSTGISVLRDHIMNVKGTLRAWNIPVANHPNDEGSSDDLAGKVRHQRDLLKIHRANLSIYLKQKQLMREEEVPTKHFHSIAHTRSEIARIKAILRGWNVTVDDLPEEE